LKFQVLKLPGVETLGVGIPDVETPGAGARRERRRDGWKRRLLSVREK